LTDFHNSFTDTFRRKLAIKLLIKIPSHLKCVATLPCEMLMIANCCIPSSHWWFRSACQSWDALT